MWRKKNDIGKWVTAALDDLAKDSFRRKRCKQCGEPLERFDKTDFCDIVCLTTYDEINRVK